MTLPFDPNQPYQLDAVATVADLFDESCPCRVRVNPQGPSGNLQGSHMA